MRQITITLADDGRITVESEQDGKPSGKPYECSSVDGCLEYLSDMIKGEEANEPGQEQEEAEPSTEAMWNQEADARAKQRMQSMSYE